MGCVVVCVDGEGVSEERREVRAAAMEAVQVEDEANEEVSKWESESGREGADGRSPSNTRRVCPCMR